MLIQPALGGHFQPGSLATLCPITKEGARTRKNKYAGRRWDMLGVLLQLVLECCLLLPQTLSWLCILSPWVSFSILSHCCCLTGNDALAVCRKIKLVLGWGLIFNGLKTLMFGYQISIYSCHVPTGTVWGMAKCANAILQSAAKYTFYLTF